MGHCDGTDRSLESPRPTPQTWQCTISRLVITAQLETHLDRGCPEGQAEACRQRAPHLWEESPGSLYGWLLSVGCDPPHPSLGSSHLGQGRKKRGQLRALGQKAQNPGPASDGHGRGSVKASVFPSGTGWSVLDSLPSSPAPSPHNLWLQLFISL